jgi:predicted permease
MITLINDLRYALRQLRKSPGFALTAVLTLALGIGAGSAIFCLIEGLWLHPIAVPQHGRLVRLFSTTPQDQNGTFSFSEYRTLAERAPAFQGASAGLVAIGGRGSLMPNPDGTSTLLLNNVVSSNFFSVLEVQPLLGRVFTSADAAQLRTHPGLVLGYRCWQHNFGADPHIIGRMIPLRRGKDHISPVEIWGVLPPSFRDVDPNSDRDLWIPAETWAALIGEGDLSSLDFRWFNLLGRLAPGVNADQANQQVSAIAAALATADPAHNRNRGARALSDFRYRLSQAGTTGVILIAIVGAVILLCTVNVAHLLLARALTRGTEVALRISLGATRWGVARQLLLENLLLCLLGWTAGLGLAAALAASLPRLLASGPAMLVPLDSPPQFPLDWRVFVLAGSLTLVTMLLLALVPVVQVAHPQLIPALQSSPASRTTGRNPTARRIAVWLQIGISFALLVSTGALVRSFLNTQTRDIGLSRKQVVVAFTQDPDRPLRDTLLTDLLAIPGAQGAAYGIRSPLMPSEGGIAAKVLLPSHPEMHDPVDVKYNAVSPGFLSVIGTRIVRGRGFTALDDANGPAVVIISQAMAEKYWPSTDPIGQTVRLPGFDNGAPGSSGVDLEARIIGVAEDAPVNQIGEIPEPYMYLPFHFSQMGELTFVVQTSQNAMSVAQDARRILIRVNPLLDPMFITSLPELIRSSAGSYQMVAELVSALGVIGLVLTIVGLYGFLAFRVTQRRREIGIRMALGASREATARMILSDTARMAAMGLVIGAALSFAAARLEASVLFGVRPLDAFSLAAAVCLLAVAVASAAWFPARRAASIEPMQALRAD